MAYTYDDFLKTASGANMLGRFNRKDMEISKTSPEYGLSMLSLMKDYDGAKTPETRLLATEAMNQLRSSYAASPAATVNSKPSMKQLEGGYSFAPGEGGDASGHKDGTQPGESQDQIDGGYTPPGTSGENGGENPDTSGSFQYDNEQAYQELLKQIANPDPFSYDPEKDPNWQAFRKMYLRQGDRAADNALARASAATGGIPSTYAVMAAQQADANYGEDLVGMLPTLEQNAYARYRDEQSLRQAALNALAADREDAYNRFMTDKKLEADVQNNLTPEPQEEDAWIDGLSDGDKLYLESAFPSGVITSESIWEEMVALYGEEALQEAGYRFAGEAKPETPDQAQMLELYGSYYPVDQQSMRDLNLGPLTMEGLDRLIEIGAVVPYLDNGMIKFRLSGPGASAGAAVGNRVGNPIGFAP